MTKPTSPNNDPKEVRQEIVDYIDQFFPNGKKPRTQPDPDKARGHALVLAGLAEVLAKAEADHRLEDFCNSFLPDLRKVSPSTAEKIDSLLQEAKK